MSFLYLAALAPTADAQPTLETLLDGLKATYGETQAIQADFTQVTRSESFGVGPEQSGQIILGRPAMMRITFQGAAGSLFLSDGSDLYVYSPANNQVIVTPDLAEKRDGVSDLLSNLSALQERFEVTLLPTAGAALELALTPRDDARFKSMQLSLTPDYRLVSLSVTDAFDTTTQMRFSNVVLDPTLPAGVFTFEIPADATVIRSGNI